MGEQNKRSSLTHQTGSTPLAGKEDKRPSLIHQTSSISLAETADKTPSLSTRQAELPSREGKKIRKKILVDFSGQTLMETVYCEKQNNGTSKNTSCNISSLLAIARILQKQKRALKTKREKNKKTKSWGAFYMIEVAFFSQKHIYDCRFSFHSRNSRTQYRFEQPFALNPFITGKIIPH